MRGQADEQVPLFHVFSVEDRIRPDHPLRDIKRRVDRILDGMSAQFAAAYQPHRSAERAAGTAAEGPAADGPLFGAERTPVVRADRHGPAVPLVPRPAAQRRRSSTRRPSRTTASGSTTTT